MPFFFFQVSFRTSQSCSDILICCTGKVKVLYKSFIDTLQSLGLTSWITHLRVTKIRYCEISFIRTFIMKHISSAWLVIRTWGRSCLILDLLRFKLLLQIWKKYKLPGSDQIPVEVIEAGGETLRSEINKLINYIWNMEKLPDQWKESIIASI
jgi:hypothetical protein